MAQRFILNKSKHLTFKPYKKTFTPKDDDKIGLIRQNMNSVTKDENAPLIQKESSVVDTEPSVSETIVVEEPKKKVVVRSKKKEESNGENTLEQGNTSKDDIQ